VETAIYSREDGIVDCRYCRIGDPKVDVEVGGTHLGLIFNSTTYLHIAERLACARGRGSLAEALVQFSGRKRFSSHFSTLGGTKPCSKPTKATRVLRASPIG